MMKADGTMSDRITATSSTEIVNSAIYALRCLQQQMAGEGHTAGLMTDEDVDMWITESRRQEE